MTNGLVARQRAAAVGAAPDIPRRSARADRLGVPSSVAIALVWPAVTAVCVALEPASTGDGGVVGAIVGLGFFVAMAGVAVAALGRHPSALAWSAAAGAGAVLMTAACPLTAHHTAIGAWWAGQWAATVGGLALTGVVATRHRRAQG